jgi:hypothetical protein
MRKYLLPESGNFYKANLHCHSTVSDGRWTVEEIKKNYAEHGYSVVAFTDHEVMIPHTELTDDKFLALTGYEMAVNPPKFGQLWRKTCHMCLIAPEPEYEQVCWHREKYLFGNAPKYKHLVRFDGSLPDYERQYSVDCVSNMMQRGRDAGFFVTYNHPAWSLEEYTEYGRYTGMHAMEICNFGCEIAGFPDYNPKIYDEMLRAGRRIFCVSTDDNHNIINDSFGGFTVIKADKLDYGSVFGALMAGNFYASQGPEIKALWYEDGAIHVECSEAVRIEFSCGVRRAACFEGEALTSADYELKPDSWYVRVTVVDKAGRHANSNAYFQDELDK